MIFFLELVCILIIWNLFLFSGLNGYLENVLEKFKHSMKEGIPSLGIPSFDPFHISELDFPTLVGAYGPYGLNVDINMDFNNLSIGQLSTYDVTYVDANLNQLSLDLQVNLCQKHSFLHQSTQNMITDRLLNSEFSTRKLQVQYSRVRNRGRAGNKHRA